MVYKNHKIVKEQFISNGKIQEHYAIYEPFEKTNLEREQYYSDINECKRVIDRKVIEDRERNNRFIPCHASQYWWTVLDLVTGLKHNDPVTHKPLMFHTREEALKWCEDNKVEIKR